ncbi:MAG: dienelactone hydrolase family protein [Pyrinomonadaceae bacterium]|nr:dienelactone hydrolase family protein [Pyrinomonadaceae bacterium]
MHETDLHLTAEIKLYYDLQLPENQTKPAPLLIAVHGYGAHKRYMMREAKLVAPENFAVVSIQAPHQHFRPTSSGYKVGFGWLTDFKSEESVAIHQNFVLQIIEKLAAENVIDERQIYLFGFSQACALNFRFALTHPAKIRGVIGIGGGIPSDLATNADYKKLNADVLYLYGDDDEFYPLEKFQTYEQKLKEIAPHLQSQCYAAKHEITDEMRETVREWLKSFEFKL